MKGIQVCSNDGLRPFPRGDNYEIVKIHWRNLKIFSRITEHFSTKLGQMHSWLKRIQISSNEGPRPFSRGDDYEIVKKHWQNLTIFFSRTTEPISTKFGTMHPWVQGIQVYSNEGIYPFLRGDNNEITRKNWRNFKIFISRTTEPILTKLGTKILGWRGFKIVQMKNHSILIK